MYLLLRLELSANFTSSPIWRDGTSLQKVTLSLQSQKKPNSYQPHKAPRLLHFSSPHTLSLTEQPAAPCPESHCVSICRQAAAGTVTPLPATGPHATLTDVRATCPQSSAHSCPFLSLPCSSPLAVSCEQHRIQPSHLCSLILPFSLQPLPNASFQLPACLLLGLIILSVTLYHSYSLSQAPGFHVLHCRVCVCVCVCAHVCVCTHVCLIA